MPRIRSSCVSYPMIRASAGLALSSAPAGVVTGSERLSMASFGEPLLGQGTNRGFARGISVDEGAAEYFGGARDVADLVIDLGGRDRGVFLAARERADG